MAMLIPDSIDLAKCELQNASLQKIAGDHPSPYAGGIWHNTTIDVVRFRTSAGTTESIGWVGSATPVALTVGGAGSAGSSLYQSRQDHSHPMPGVATAGVSGFMSSTDKSKLDAAASGTGSNTLVMRDANGRFQVADPSSGLDVANYQWTLSQIALAKAGLAWKEPVRTVFTGNQAGTYVAGTKRLTASVNGILPTNDGVASFAANDRICLNGQTDQKQNGIWVIIDPGTAGTPFILERSYDFGGPNGPANDVFSGAFFVCKEGAQFANTTYVCTNNASVVIDTTSITFQQDVKAAVDNVTIQVNANGDMEVKIAGISYAKIQNVAALSVFGRASNTAGVGADITSSADNQVLTRSGTSLVWGPVGNAMLASMAARSIKGNWSNTAGTPTDVAPTAADQQLQANATNTGLEWGTLRTAGITNSAVTYAKIQNVTATNRVLGRITASAGIVEELTPANLRALLASDITNGVQLKAVQYTIGDGTTSNIVVTHNLGTQNIVDVVLRRVSNNSRAQVGWTANSTAQVTLTFGAAPAASSYVATILYV